MKKNRPQRVDPLHPPKQQAPLFYEQHKQAEVAPIRRKPNYFRIFLAAILILAVVIGISFLFLYINQSIFGKDNASPLQTSALPSQTMPPAEAETGPAIASNEIAILNPPRLSVEAAQAFAKAKNAHPDFINLAPIFWRVAAEYQVDPLVVYCQSALETGFMHFNGVVSREFCNPCGLKTTIGGGDYEESAHMRFPDWESGIRAQVQHLALYAGSENTPVKTPLDPRHFPYLKGTAPSVEALSKKWAPAEDYGQIIREMMEEALKYAR